MTALSNKNPTLLDLAQIQGADGTIQDVIEILNATNEILDDMTWMEGNLPTGHKASIRSGLPTPTWRKLYGGVQPTKATNITVTDACGDLEAYAEVDARLVELSTNPAQFRLNQDRAHIEAISQEIASTLFYGNETTEPEAFTGLAPRFNSLSAENGQNIIAGGGAGSDNTSIWLVVWGPRTCHGIIPKGSKAGMQVRDLGEVTVENVDGSNGRAQMYRTHYKMSAGLHVADWRSVVRIANIDKSALTGDASSGADIIDLMTQAIERVHSLNAGRPVFYCSRNTKAFLRRQMVAKVKNSTLMMDQVAGKHVMTLDGIPVKRCDALSSDEALVS